MSGATVQIVQLASTLLREQGAVQTVLRDKILLKGLVDAQDVPLITSIRLLVNYADNVIYVLPTNTGSIAAVLVQEVAQTAIALPINIRLVAAPGPLVQVALAVLPTRMVPGATVPPCQRASLWQATMAQDQPHNVSRDFTAVAATPETNVLPIQTAQQGLPTSTSAWPMLDITGLALLLSAALVTIVLVVTPGMPAQLARSLAPPQHQRAPRAQRVPLPRALGFPCVFHALPGS
jgi:hypothetical protein